MNEQKEVYRGHEIALSHEDCRPVVCDMCGHDAWEDDGIFECDMGHRSSMSTEKAR